MASLLKPQLNNLPQNILIRIMGLTRAQGGFPRCFPTAVLSHGTHKMTSIPATPTFKIWVMGGGVDVT